MSKNIDKLRYIAAFIIVLLHVNMFEGINPYAHFFLNNIISRVTVPFFFVTTGFIVGIKVREQGVEYINMYIKRSLPSYLIWSAIYIIPGLDFLIGYNLPVFLYPAGLLVGLIYLGTYYHLWFYPALFSSLLLLKTIIKKEWFKPALIISIMLLLLGSFETYYGLIPFQMLKSSFDIYLSIFMTTRNFLFFGLFYVLVGYLLSSYKVKEIDLFKKLTLLFFVMLIIEGVLIYGIERKDSNILLMAAPFIICLFLWQNNEEKELWLPKFKHNFRDLSKYYYFVHPLIVWLYQKGSVLFFSENTILNNGLIKACIIVVIVHTCANVLIDLSASQRKPFRYL